MGCNNTKNTNDEYTLEIDEDGKIFIQKSNKKNQKKINIFFTNEKTNIMEDILKQLTKFFIEETLKL